VIAHFSGGEGNLGTPTSSCVILNLRHAVIKQITTVLLITTLLMLLYADSTIFEDSVRSLMKRDTSIEMTQYLNPNSQYSKIEVTK
jgi:hypothetical protein